MRQNVAAGCTLMFNKPVAELALMYDDVDNIMMHDWWIALIASTFGMLQYIDKPLILYRQHASNVVGATNNGFKWISRIVKTLLIYNKFVYPEAE